MYKKAIAISVCAVVLFSGCGKRNFSEFTSKEGGFKVLMPGTPKEKKQDAQGVNMSMYIVEESSGAYFASYADLPIPKNEPDAKIQQRLDDSVKGAVTNVSAKVTSQSNIKLDGKYPGREIAADVPSKNGAMKLRIYFVGTRLYQVMVLGTKSWLKSSDSSKFFDSFQLTK